MRIKSIDDLVGLRKSIQMKRDPDKKCITVCAGTGCRASGSEVVITAFKEEIKKKGLEDELEIRATGCHGFCERGPIVVINPQGIFYPLIDTEHVPKIMDKTIIEGEIIEDLLYSDPLTGEKIVYEKDIPFYKRQQRLVLGNNGKIDPTEIDDYIAINGYSALIKVFTEMNPAAVIDEVKKSGLRGRGGAGFPTGLKWEISRKTRGYNKYIVCNADEGDPGAYMDRSVLEGNPHSVLEGMLIGAYAINILGSNFDFDVSIIRGAGAFVCGEETALMASIEGRKGVPRQRPPFPAQKGIWGKPTNINNVETWANVPLIILNGASWYSKLGTDSSKGTKIFSLVGKLVLKTWNR
jgi:NADH-quinone oxidoreductase subunit F